MAMLLYTITTSGPVVLKSWIRQPITNYCILTSYYNRFGGWLAFNIICTDVGANFKLTVL